MSEITVRTATLDDAAAITAIHTSNIPRWQRVNAQGEVEDVPYEALSVYERWLHGGPWMSVEMCAVHLTHLLRGAGVPLVAVVGGQVWAEAEVFHGVEPEPFGDHLNLSLLYTHKDYAGRGLGSALMNHILDLGRKLACRRVSVAHAEAVEFYQQHGLRHVASGQGMSWPARPGQIFYQATPHPHADPAQIRGWAMPLGRSQSAHQQWVTLWPDLWAGVPELQQRRVERFKFQMAGGSFFVLYAESRFDPRRARVYVWSAQPITGPLMAAINDKAHKLGFRRLETYVMETQAALLGPDAEPDGTTQDLYSIDL